MTFIIIFIISEKCPHDTTNGHGGAEKDQSKTDQTMLRPLSMNNVVIADDQAGNPYVDLPSKVGTTATASFMLPPGGIEADKPTKTET